MKPLLFATVWLASAAMVQAQLNIPGADGTDGELASPVRPTSTQQIIDLSEAITGKWDQPSTSPGKGVYDPEKWAVVFKYSSVNIRSNTVIRFKNHPSRAPVVWLVSGDVNIGGVVDLSGNPPDGINPPESGPGGFRGGTPLIGNQRAGAGFGPGGGNAQGFPQENWGTYADYSGDPIRLRYGNTQIVPLIGGSGSGGINDGRGGNSAGGAILIATKQILTVNGLIISISGDPRDGNHWRGSGGAIRLIANQIFGRGNVDVASDSNVGRMRLETPSYGANLRLFPATLVVAPASPPLIWPKANAIEARIVSVAGKNAPTDPVANLNAAGTDVSFQDDQPVDIFIETKNVDVNGGGVVNLRISELHGPASVIPAQFVSGTTAKSTWIVTTKMSQGFAALQAQAVSP